MAHVTTPADLTITPRDRRFGRGVKKDRWWHGGDPIATAFYNALSATFPKGEKLFIDSVRAFRDGTPPRLGADIKAFVTQEAMHTREHEEFNAKLEQSGYDIAPLLKAVDDRLDLLATRPKIASLAVTMALEHFTAILAHELLRDPRHLEGADKASADLWRWHAIEEVEHKAVAYDTWLHVTGDWSRWKRWKIKSLLMLIVTRNFLVDRTKGVLELLRQDGLTGPAVWARMAWFAFGRPGMMRRVMGLWFLYFLPRFHPWQHDDRDLIADAEKDLGGEGPPRHRFQVAPLSA